ncbi:MAG: molecular chaperone HtpG [Clostridiales bacterium]|nr:molecular chaperone HtpG [Clostridiales bacterium]
MTNEKGSLSINSENILPIIKKWLYSDSDIFVRELVSNGVDAITKLKKLVDLGETENIPENEEYFINVTLDRDNKTITFEDNGIGMTADEIKTYINEIAFSGANAFLEKYKDKMDKNNEIIGHFGLGFYSSFMAADKVTIDSKSYIEGSQAAFWSCEGGIEFEMTESEKQTRGTVITLYIGEGGKDFLESYKLRNILTKYCGFVPVNIYFESLKTEEEKKQEEKDRKKREKEQEKERKEKAKEKAKAKAKAEKDGDVIDIIDEDEPDSADGTEAETTESAEAEAKEPERKPVNDISPLWVKKPSECTDEEYKEFYHKVFMDFGDPLFWIHLNMDYPFRLKGILYFPKLKHELESIEGQVKLYNNQVFIADNIKEVIPEFLLLLKGTLDCPDLPLNVSRSFLQNDGYVTKMSGYITKKVADKLNSLFKKDREKYNSYWEDINPFIKYGCIKERTFYDKIKDSIIYKTINDEYVTLADYLEKAKEKHENTVFYVSNEQQQAQYIKLFKDFGMDAVVLTANLDNPFISYLESYDYNVKFNRIDSDISDFLKEKGEENEETGNADLDTLFREKLGNEKLNIRSEALKADSVSAIILLPEHSRRMQEMSKMFGQSMPGMMGPSEETLVLNTNNSLVKTLLSIKDDENRSNDVTLICEQIYDLAMMSHRPLEVDAMNKFIERSNKILERIAAH